MEACCNNFMDRWTTPSNFQSPTTYGDLYELQNSVAGSVNEVVANLHNRLMSGDDSTCYKMVGVILLEVLLLSTAPLIAVAETILRLALAVIASPLLIIAGLCSVNDKSWMYATYHFGLSAFYSLWYQLPTTFVVAYEMVTSQENIVAFNKGK